ncbi:MAG TPA: RNA polymerase sigma factor [Polyangiaceae bacterium]|nr:RNA polymerase sigma factor [Polyangiaceae bacterium]
MSQTVFSLREFSFAEDGEAEEPDAPGERPVAATRMLCRSDEQRLRAMVEGHFDFIWRSLRRLGVPPDSVDDATQRVFLVTAKNLPQIAVERERAFLFSVAVRVASDARRARSRRHEISEPDAIDGAAHPVASPEELLDQKRAREILDSLLEDIPMDLRTVLVLVEGEGLTGTEVASLLGIAEGTVNSRLRRGREALTRRVERWKRAMTKAASNT